MAQRPIELELNRKNQQFDSALVELADRLLDLVAGLAPESSPADPTSFRKSVAGWRTALRQAHDPWNLERLVPRIVAECEQFFAQVRNAEGERDGEMSEVVAMLREVLTTLRGEAEGFDERFAQSASTFAGMAAIEDIRELRQALAREVETLKKIVADRKANEEAAYGMLTQRVEKLEANLQEARDEAAKDGLTGVANRRSFDRALARLVARAERDEFSFTLAMVDVDDFKRINDDHGHPVGDRVLICVANLLTANVRSADVVARYGGEEFAILFEHMTASQARGRLQQLIDSVAETYSYEDHGEKGTVAFTFSIGATDYHAGDSGEAMVKRADDALYQAKRKGKKRLEVSSPRFLKRLLG